MSLESRPNAGRHVLLPNMSYACGGSILTKDGGFTVGVGAGQWDDVTCPECRGYGRDYLAAVCRYQQGIGEHPDALAVPDHHAVPETEAVALW